MVLIEIWIYMHSTNASKKLMKCIPRVLEVEFLPEKNHMEVEGLGPDLRKD